MNYRHAFHAGNFADVMKHVVLTRIVELLKLKDKAFRIIDTHAGTGFYDLASGAASKTGEWQAGIGRVVDAVLPPAAAALALPYIDAVRAANAGGPITRYPGSPWLARHLMRNQDRLTAIELHPTDASTLKENFAGDFQTRVIELDGWLALGAHVPPKEKRGLVLVDPPFEEDGEFGRMLDGLAKAHRRWPNGTYMLWYPIKDRTAVNAFRSALKESGIPKILDVRLLVRRPSNEARLDGSGLVLVNPPFGLEAELKVLLPALVRVLEDAPTFGKGEMEWLAGE